MRSNEIAVNERSYQIVLNQHVTLGRNYRQFLLVDLEIADDIAEQFITAGQCIERTIGCV